MGRQQRRRSPPTLPPTAVPRAPEPGPAAKLSVRATAGLDLAPARVRPAGVPSSGGRPRARPPAGPRDIGRALADRAAALVEDERRQATRARSPARRGGRERGRLRFAPRAPRRAILRAARSRS